MRRSLQFIALTLCLIVVPISSTASDMSRVVRTLESNLGLRHTHIPMLGMAMFVGKVATGFQMPGVKLAVFENATLSQRSSAEIEHALLNALGPQWSPFVKSTSRYGDEQNWIYINAEGKKLQMMIASAQGNELSLVEVKMSERQMRKWINDADEMAHPTMASRLK